MSIAPWQVEVCNLRCGDEAVSRTADALYDALQSAGIETLYDDRNIRPGAMFADADLFGIPIRAVVSPKTCGRGVIEVSLRDKSWKGEFEAAKAAEKIAEMVRAELDKYKLD